MQILIISEIFVSTRLHTQNKTENLDSEKSIFESINLTIWIGLFPICVNSPNAAHVSLFVYMCEFLYAENSSWLLSWRVFRRH